MQSVSINDRVENIKSNENEINRFVEEYKPFIASCVEKAIGRYVNYGSDDELSIGLIAFVEAIKSYNHEKGSFLTLAQNVIKRRLIDYYRKEKKYSNVISLNEHYKIGEEDEQDLSVDASIANYDREVLSEYRRLELEELKEELQHWGISFVDLAEASPKHNKSRKSCTEIIKFLLAQPHLLKLLKNKKYLPIAEIEKFTQIPRKKIERARKYIIAVILITTGDYQYIRDYINWR